MTAAVALTWLTTPNLVLGAPATPSSVPAPVCDVPARTPDEILELLAMSGVATPAATTAGQTLPEGVPADPEMVGTMEDVVRLWLACQNAGEQLRAWSLFSDGYLYRLLSRQGGITSDAFHDLATTTPSSIDSSMLIEIAGHRVLPDGRFGATVGITYPSIPMPKQFFFYFIEVDGRLLIDSILGEISFSIP